MIFVPVRIMQHCHTIPLWNQSQNGRFDPIFLELTACDQYLQINEFTKPELCATRFEDMKLHTVEQFPILKMERKYFEKCFEKKF